MGTGLASETLKMIRDDNLMVRVRDAHKVLGSHQVLNGLNMSVNRGHIYGLLGPSGCGKTVLLNCILGVRPLDEGAIKLGITERRLVGYMPQEVALFNELTIKEIFIFYGRLFGVFREIIEVKYEDCIDILGLPDWNCTIGSLSGGEQRRVSFAVTLLHEPELLVLDEPTVGVDSILSQRIWKYLLQLSSKGRTIIITTHYVEEARHSHTVGMMRAGVIIREDSPKNIMTSLGVSTLEEAFLDLSKKQDTLQLSSSSPSKYAELLKSTRTETPLNNESIFNKHRFNAQLVKNIIWIKRNTLMMMFLLLLPAMQSFFYSISFGQNPTNLKFIMYSEEFNRSYGVDNCKYIQYVDIDDCTLKIPLSCDFIDYLQKSMDISLVYSMESAKSRVLQNKAWGLIHLKANFSNSLIERIKDITSQDSDVIDNSFAYISMDMSNYIVANYLQKEILDSFNAFRKALLKACNVSERYGSIPMKFENPIYGSNNPVYAHSGLPGFFCSFCFYFTMIFTSGAIMMEKLVGLQERNMVAGMTYYEVVSAHIAVQFLLISVQKAIMLLVFYVCFYNPFIGSATLMIILMYCIEAVGVAYGMFLTEVFASERLVSYGGIGATLAVFSLGSIIWPMEGAHILIRSWVWAFPVVPAVDAYRAIALKGYGIAAHQVYNGFISCFVWTTLLLLISIILAKSRKLK